MPPRSDLAIRYVVSLVDHGTKPLLAQDRKVRKSLADTDRQCGTAARAATSAASRQVAAAARTERGLRGVGRAAGPASQDIHRYAAAQRQALTVGARLVAQAPRAEAAYRREGRAAAAAGRQQQAAGAATSRAGGHFRKVAAGAAGLAASYIGIGAAKSAVATTTDLAKATLMLNRNLGLSTEQAGQWAAVAKVRGIDTKALGMSFTSLSRQTEAASSALKKHQAWQATAKKGQRDTAFETNKQITNFRALGVSMDTIRSRDFNRVLMESADGLGEMQGNTQRAAVAQAMFGRGAQTIVPLMKEGSAGLREQMTMASKYGAVMSGKGLTGVKDFIAKQRESKMAMLGLSVTFGTTVAPTLTKMITGIADLIGNIKQGTGAGLVLKQIGAGVRGVGEAIAPVVVGVGHFVGQHPGLLKVAGGMLAVAAAVKAIRFAGSISGVTSLIGLLGRLRGAGAVATATAQGAASAVIPPPPGAAVRGGLRGRLAGVRGRLGRGAGIAGLGVMGAQIAGGAIGGKTGAAVSAIGSGAATGAGLGSMILPGVGTAVGAVGGAVVGGLIHFIGKSEDRIQGAVAKSLTMRNVNLNVGNVTVSKQEVTSMADAIRKARQAAHRQAGDKSADRVRKVIGIGSGATKDAAERARQYARAGQIGVGIARRVISSGPRYQTSQSLVREFEHDLKLVPPAFRRGAAKTMVQYAQELKASGRLPQNELRMLVRSLSARYGDLVPGARQSGRLANRAMATELRAGNARAAAQKLLANLATTFRGLPQNVRLNASNAQRVLSGSLATLRQTIRTTHGQEQADARAALSRLLATTKTYTRQAAKAATANSELMAAGVLRNLRKMDSDSGNIFANIGRRVEGAYKTRPTPVGPQGLPSGSSRRRRRGGLVFREGGLVPALVSSGEEIIQGGRSWMVPGPRVAADNVLTMLRPGAAVLTEHGQGLRAGGASVGEAVAAQAPHFRTGGVLSPSGIGGLASDVGLRGSSLVRSIAVALAESAGRVRASNRNTDGSIDRGLWQINSVHGALSTFDPRGNARAMDKISSGGRNWSPWAAFTNGSYRSHEPAARRGAKSPAATSGRGETRGKLVPGKLPKLEKPGERPFTAGYQAGLEGARSLRGVGDILPESLASVRISRPTRTPKDRQRGRGPTLKGASARGALGRAVAAASAISGRRYPYSTPGDRSMSIPGGAMDCSGAVSKVVGAAGLLGSVQASPYFLNWGLPGRGKQISTWSRGGLGASGHVFMGLAGRYFGTSGQNPGGGAGWMKSFPGGSGYTVRHPRGFRTGGVVGRDVGRALFPARTGSQVARLGALPATNDANARAVGMVRRIADGLDDTGRVSYRRLSRLASGLERSLARLRRGAEDRGQQVQIRRLTAILRLTDTEMGRRTGLLVRRVGEQRAAMERSTAALSRRLRVRGVDEGSVGGLTATMRMERAQQGQSRQQFKQLTTARARARKAGDRGTAGDLTTQIRDLRDTISEVATTLVEQARQKIAAAAQATVDKAQYSLDVTQTALEGLDILQRLGGTADTAAGMASKATAIQTTLIPALMRWRDSMIRLAVTLGATGDIAGANAAANTVLQAANQIASAMADASDLLRQAAMKVVSDRVDAATSGETFANLGLARLELEQRIAGTFDHGGQQRADYINATVLPAIQAAIAALNDQRAEAVRQGDIVLARQIAEQMAGKKNDQLQAILDATEQTAANTAEALKQFGGTTAFEYGGQRFTDLLSVGVGA